MNKVLNAPLISAVDVRVKVALHVRARNTELVAVGCAAFANCAKEGADL